MNPNPWTSAIPLAYLLGSIPFGYLLVRLFLKQDVRAIGSGNIGATNVLRSGKKLLGIATLLLDLGKAVAAVLLAFEIAKRAGLPQAAAYDLASAAAIAAVVGHVYPVWLGFKGGKGVASALGVFLALSPPTVLSALGVFLLVVPLTRYVSLGSILAAASLPLFALLYRHSFSPIQAAAFVGIPLVVIAKHHANIGRLRAGTESRLGQKTQRPKGEKALGPRGGKIKRSRKVSA